MQNFTEHLAFRHYLVFYVFLIQCLIMWSTGCFFKEEWGLDSISGPLYMAPGELPKLCRKWTWCVGKHCLSSRPWTWIKQGFTREESKMGEFYPTSALDFLCHVQKVLQTEWFLISGCPTTTYLRLWFAECRTFVPAGNIREEIYLNINCSTLSGKNP